MAQKFDEDLKSEKNTQNSLGLLGFFSQTQDKNLFIVHIEGIVHSVHIVLFAYRYIVPRTFCAMAILTSPASIWTLLLPKERKHTFLIFERY